MNYSDYNIRYQNWLSDPTLSAEALAELKSISDNEKEIEYRFSKELDFGTAGMRGLMGYGTNMMNIYTVRRATKGLADYITENGAKAKLSGVVISYDTRNDSLTFAKAAAGVLVQNGIQVYIYSQARPVPMLSYAVRELHAFAGIMITASHNPKEYNGYKVYGADGAQLSIEATAKVVSYIDRITDHFSVKWVNIKEKTAIALLSNVPKRIERKYYKTIISLGLSRKLVRKNGKKLNIVYTPLHGTGYTPVTTVLKKMGLKVQVVEEQIIEDGNFPTVKVPNPEDKTALEMGMALAEKVKADVVFGTDPDCDRLGVAVRNHQGEFVGLSGNQVGVLMLSYILERLKQNDELAADSIAVKSFVSTNLAKALCDSYGVTLKETPVGFKYIGEQIKNMLKDKSGTFIFGFEESCGYLRGTHSRDKDAVVASMIFAELAVWCESKGKSVYDLLLDIYDKYGYVYDKTVSIAYSGVNAMNDMNAVVEKMRKNTLEKINIYNVIAVRDYLSGKKTFVGSQETQELDYSDINCLYYELENGSFICLRPSGTEPKLKIYFSISAPNEELCLKCYQSISQDFLNLIGA